MHLDFTEGLSGQLLLSPQVRWHFSLVHFLPTAALQEGFIELLLVVVVGATVVLVVCAAAVVGRAVVGANV
jgi:hypothetical protein